MSADDNNWLSASQLARLGAAKVVPGMPRTERNAREVARRSAWPQRSVEGGGGAGGMRTEYQPPADVLALIQPFLAANPEFFAKSGTRTRTSPEKTKSLPDGLTRVDWRDERYPIELLDDDVKKSPEYFSAGKGHIMLPLYPSLALEVSATISGVYGADDSLLDHETRTRLFLVIYEALCKLGVSETDKPSLEEIEVLLRLAIKYGKAPAPAK